MENMPESEVYAHLSRTLQFVNEGQQKEMDELQLNYRITSNSLLLFDIDRLRTKMQVLIKAKHTVDQMLEEALNEDRT